MTEQPKPYTGTVKRALLLACEVDAVNGEIVAIRAHPSVRCLIADDGRGDALVFSAAIDPAERARQAVEYPELEAGFAALERAVGAAKESPSPWNRVVRVNVGEEVSLPPTPNIVLDALRNDLALARAGTDAWQGMAERWCEIARAAVEGMRAMAAKGNAHD